MKASEKLISKIKEFEGVKLTAYQDAVGVWTIGVGHTGDVKKGDTITIERANTLLAQDLKRFEQGVEKIATENNLSFTQGQFDALVDFSFNLGLGALKSSTLLKKIILGASASQVREQFLRWNKAGGKVLPGLTRRREWEALRYAE